MNRLPALLCALLTTVLMGLSPLPEVHGRVVGVTDGDTIRVLSGRDLVKIRLKEIDAPEHGQPFGEASKQMLAAMVYGRQVHYVWGGEDRYGRTLARIYVDGGADVSAEMVSRGGAWAFRRYLTDQHILVLEAEARRARRGLWALQADQVEAPWEWRRERRHQH